MKLLKVLYQKQVLHESKKDFVVNVKQVEIVESSLQSLRFEFVLAGEVVVV